MDALRPRNPNKSPGGSPACLECVAGHQGLHGDPDLYSLAQMAISWISSRRDASRSRHTALRDAELSCDDARNLLRILRSRQSGGLETNLGQLHLITSSTQWDALRALRTLENAELVRVDRDIHDAFASTVHVIDL